MPFLPPGPIFGGRDSPKKEELMDESMYNSGNNPDIQVMIKMFD
jgi:hypothetical protein